MRPEWDVIADSREQALAKRALKDIEMGKRELKPLSIGDSVQIQNQTGNHPGKWFNTGVIAEVLPNRQYHVVVDGSRRISLHNRRFLKKIQPISRKMFDLTPDASTPANLTPDTSILMTPANRGSPSVSSGYPQANLEPTVGSDEEHPSSHGGDAWISWGSHM